MRPRKRILLIDSEEANIATIRYVLDTQHFRPLYAGTAEEALPLLPCDLVLIYCHEPEEGEAIGKKLKAVSQWTPTALVLDAKKMVDFVSSSDGFIDRLISTADLIERVKTMSARKRGPRKGSIKSSVSTYRRYVAKAASKKPQLTKTAKLRKGIKNNNTIGSVERSGAK